MAAPTTNAKFEPFLADSSFAQFFGKQFEVASPEVYNPGERVCRLLSWIVPGVKDKHLQPAPVFFDPFDSIMRLTTHMYRIRIASSNESNSKGMPVPVSSPVLGGTRHAKIKWSFEGDLRLEGRNEAPIFGFAFQGTAYSYQILLSFL